jgi:hypothetical protein
MASDERHDESLTSDDEGAEGFSMPVVPAELGIEPMLLGLLHAAAFLDLAGDDSVDEQDAGDALEHIGLYVQRLSPERLTEVAAQLERLEQYGKQNGWPGPVNEFVADFLYNCGIGDEEDEDEVD